MLSNVFCVLQRAHHSCLQRWIDEREVVEGREDPLVCEICKTKYKGEYTVPPRRPGRTERVQIGRDVFLIVVDPQSGLATARPLNGFEEYDPDGEDVADRLNPLAACAVSFVLFTLCSLLLSHLFASLPASFSPGKDQTSSQSFCECNSLSRVLVEFVFLYLYLLECCAEGDTPEAMDEAADAQFQDISATLLLLWLMMRLLVLVAPMYALRRLLINVRGTKKHLSKLNILRLVFLTDC